MFHIPTPNSIMQSWGLKTETVFASSSFIHDKRDVLHLNYHACILLIVKV